MTKYIIDFHWPDDWPSQRYILAENAIAARAVFEGLYPDCIIDNVRDYNSVLAERMAE